MTSYDVDKLLGATAPKKPNPFLNALLIFYFFVMSLTLLGRIISTSAHLPVLLVLLIVGLAIGLPLQFREKLNWHWRKRHITALSLFGTSILLAILCAVFPSNNPTSANSMVDTSTTVSSKPYFDDTPSSSSETTSSSNTHAIGEQFQVGYTQYKVLSKKWQQQLGNGYFGSTADGRYLLVRVQVKNLDREERLVPQFTLVDETGAEYKESSDSMYLGKEAPLLKSLNPSVQTKLTALFDVPPEHHYTLKLSGGYWSGDEALVPLN